MGCSKAFLFTLVQQAQDISIGLFSEGIEKISSLQKSSAAMCTLFQSTLFIFKDKYKDWKLSFTEWQSTCTLDHSTVSREKTLQKVFKKQTGCHLNIIYLLHVNTTFLSKVGECWRPGRLVIVLHSSLYSKIYWKVK